MADQTHSDSHAKTPLETAVESMLDSLRDKTAAPDAAVSCTELVALIGVRSHMLVITIFSALNLLPGPPGYSTMLGLAIMAFAVLMLRHQPLRLWEPVGRFKLHAGIMVKMVEFLALFARLVARFSRQRATMLTGKAMTPVIAGLAFLMGVAMLCPIPFTNMLPSLGLALAGVGMLNRDGYALIVGVVIALLGLLVLCGLLWVLFVVGIAVGDAVIDEIME